jgi:hypothetical protein
VGKRDIKTTEKLRIKELGISYGWIATDICDSFLAAFREYRHLAGKAHTVGTTPTGAPDQAGVSAVMLFFQDSGEPPESV